MKARNNIQLLALLLCTVASHGASVRSSASASASSARELQTAFGTGSIDLMDANADKVVATLTNNAVIAVSSIPGMATPSFNLAARFSGAGVGSVVFGTATNPRFRADSVAPYSFCGNSGSNFNVCNSLKVGTYTITVTPYSLGDGTGVAGTPTTITFTIVSGDAPTTPTAPVKAPTKAPITGPSPVPVTAPTKAPATAPAPVPVKAPTKAPVAPAPIKAPTKGPVTAPVPVSASAKWINSNTPIIPRYQSCFTMVNNPVVGRRAYLVGGIGSNKDTEVYNPFDKTWSLAMKPPVSLSHMNCVAAQGKLWIPAAWDGEKNTDFTYVYDPATDTWGTKNAMPLDRRRGAAPVMVSADETKIYVSHGTTGGHEWNQNENKAVSLPYLDVYDIATDTWTALSSTAPNLRDHAGGAIVNNKLICMAGGRHGGEYGFPAVEPTDCFNLETNAWEVKPPLSPARSRAQYATTCDGKLMVAGGEYRGTTYNQVDIFDGTSWTKLPANLPDKGRHSGGLAVDCACDQYHLVSGLVTSYGDAVDKTMSTYYPEGVVTQCSLTPTTRAPKAPTKAPVPTPPTAPTAASVLRLDLMYTGNPNQNSPVVTTLNIGTINVIDMATLNLPSVSFSVRAESAVSGQVNSVEFSNGQSESGSPMGRCGNGGNVLRPCSDLVLGETVVVSVIPYPQSGQKGTAFPTVATVVKIVDSRIAPTPAPVRAPTPKCAIPELAGTAWKPGRPYPLNLAEAQGMIIGDIFVVYGGFWKDWNIVSAQTWTLDTSDLLATWQRVDDIPISEGLTHGAHVQIGTKIYNCGGYVGPHPGVHTTKCIVYDQSAPLGQRWSQIAGLPSGRGGGGMFYNSELNTIYYVSGAQRYKTNGLKTLDFNTTWGFSLSNPTAGWVQKADLPYASNHMQAVTAKDGNGKEHHYANGGQYQEDEPNGNYKEHYEYLAREDKWVARKFMPYARAHASSSTHGLGCGYVMVAGNTNGNLIISNVTYYSIETDSWTDIGNVPHELNTPICDINRNTNVMYCETGRLWTTRSYTREIYV